MLKRKQVSKSYGTNILIISFLIQGRHSVAVFQTDSVSTLLLLNKVEKTRGSLDETHNNSVFKGNWYVVCKFVLQCPGSTQTHRSFPRNPGPDLRPGLLSLTAALLTSRTGAQKLRAVRWISSKTHSSDDKSAPGPPLDTGKKCKTTAGTWNQESETEGGRGWRVFSEPRSSACSGGQGAKACPWSPRKFSTPGKFEVRLFG